MTDFHWQRPGWLLAFLLLAGVIVLLRRVRSQAGNWGRLVDRSLMPHVLIGATSSTAGVARAVWLTGLIGVLGVLALAGPAWTELPQPAYRSADALVIVLDLSRSMDANDIRPSRLERARLKIKDVLQRRDSGQTALVVFSGRGFVVTPLTDDVDTIDSLVSSLTTEIMPSRGSFPEMGLSKAAQLLEQAGAPSGDVLLLTDALVSTPMRDVVVALQSRGFRTSILGVGTVEGGPIPLSAGGFLRDSKGQLVLTRLQPDALTRLAALGGGRFHPLSVDDADLDALLAPLRASGVRAEQDDTQLQTDRWREEGPWLVLAMLPMAALAFRRGWVVAVLLIMVSLPMRSEALEWKDLWRTKDQRAAALLQQGQPELAAELFANPEWKSAAQYLAGEYADSAATLEGMTAGEMTYNRGNALAKSGQFDAAIEAYNQVLEQLPQHEDARYNLDLLLQQQEQQQPQQGEGDSADQEQNQQAGESDSAEGQDSEDEGDTGDQPQDASADSSADDEQQDQQGSQDDSTQRQADNDESSRDEEAEQAIQQWLRRIPDDPGGLLRRKFRYQYQREGRDQDGNPVWPDNPQEPW